MRLDGAAKGFCGELVDRGIVVGRGESARVNGLAIVDGKEAWPYRGNAAKLDPVGAGLFTATVGGFPTRAPDSVALLDLSAGRPPAGLDEKALGEPTDLSCWHDRRSMIVCTVVDKQYQKRVFALDALTGKDKATPGLAPPPRSTALSASLPSTSGSRRTPRSASRPRTPEGGGSR
ncbi:MULTISPECIES: hypothetical protein [unclassified Streptomyces]|uniref:hypothetical protein n=1 Tax=unclassified Streptomyces TaxID=2593676 RepID=UPI0013A6B815|nr:MULTISPECIES: hypothetical protein [unclassified Streptomyces]